MKKINICIVGAGNICQHAHLPVYKDRDDIQIVAICDWNLERAQGVAKEYGIPRAFRTVEEALEQVPEIDAVDICVWNRSHASVAIAAAKAGKHILCEKPMAWSVEQAEEMRKAVNENGVTFMLAVMSRFHNDTQLLKELIDDGKLGDIYYAKTAYVRRRGTPLGWFTDTAKAGGGPVIDIGVHCIDRTWYLMGKPKPVRISASTSYAIGDYQTKGVSRWVALDSDVTAFDTEDSACGVIHFENGATMLFEVSWAINLEPNSNTWLAGDKGGAMLSPLTVYSEENHYLSDTTLTTQKNNAYATEIDHWLDCIRTGKTPIASVDDGVTVQKMLEGIYTSAKLHKEITLD